MILHPIPFIGDAIPRSDALVGVHSGVSPANGSECSHDTASVVRVKTLVRHKRLTKCSLIRIWSAMGAEVVPSMTSSALSRNICVR